MTVEKLAEDFQKLRGKYTQLRMAIMPPQYLAANTHRAFADEDDFSNMLDKLVSMHLDIEDYNSLREVVDGSVPTVGDVERWLRKLSLMQSDGVKVIYIKGLVQSIAKQCLAIAEAEADARQNDNPGWSAADTIATDIKREFGLD